MRVLDPQLNTVLDALGATAEDKGALVAFLENQASSAAGRVAGLDSSIEDLQRQRSEAQFEADRLATMLDKFTDAAE